MSSDSEKVTHIDLGEMRKNGLECNEQSLIHREQFHKVCEIISKRLDESVGYNPSEAFTPINDIISIFARRGAGKTTFVKTLIELVKKGKLKGIGIKPCDLMCIDVIEPNQMHRKENFLIRFLASIQEQFEKENDGLNDKVDTCLRNVKDDLYEALPIIDGIGKLDVYSDWDDSDYLAGKYIQFEQKVRDLERRFHIYIHKILKLSNRKALLLILDDSDVNIEKTFEILEIIRLLFTSPQIIVVMTGDPSLYGMAIRRNYWRFFDKEFIEKDGMQTMSASSKRQEYYKLVNQLEAQYLQKMIKPEHRIILNSVYEKYYKTKDEERKDQYSIMIKFSTGTKTDEEISLHNVYKKILEEVQIISKYTNYGDLEVFVNNLLKQPFRNQYRLLSAYDEYWVAKEKNNSNKDKNAKANVIALAEVIINVFEVYINQSSPDSKKLLDRTPIYSGWLIKFLIDNNIVFTGSHMLPNIGDDKLDNSLFALCIWCGSQIQADKSIAFDFLIRVSFVRQVLLVLNEDGKSFEDCIHICHDVDVHKILGNIHAYFNAKIKASFPGTKKINKQYPFAGVCTLEAPIIPSDVGVEGDIVNLIQLISLSADTTKTYICSFYKLIASLAELLREYEDRKVRKYDVITKYEKENNWLKLKLDNISQFHTYMESSFGETYQTNEEGISIQKIKTSSSNKSTDFLEDMIIWLKSIETKWITPQSLDRIFTRTYYTLTVIDSKAEYAFKNVGDRFSDYVLAFWNACIVEEKIISDDTDEIILGYEGDMGEIFIKNYRDLLKCWYVVEITEDGDVSDSSFDNKDSYDYEQSFAEEVINCPLLRAFVNPQVLTLIDEENKQVEGSAEIENVKEITVDDYSSVRDLYAIENLEKALNELSNKIDIKRRELTEYQNELSKWSQLGNYVSRKERIEEEIKILPIETPVRKNFEAELNKIDHLYTQLISECNSDRDKLNSLVAETLDEINSLYKREQNVEAEKGRRENQLSVPEGKRSDLKNKFQQAIDKIGKLSIYDQLKERLLW